MDKIDGYEIQKTILFETGYGFALGCMPGTPEKSAEENFQMRAERWRMMYGVQEKTEDSTAVFYRYYSMQRPVDIATYPQPEGNSPVMITNYNEDRRHPVAGGRLCAWGVRTLRLCEGPG